METSSHSGLNGMPEPGQPHRRPGLADALAVALDLPGVAAEIERQLGHSALPHSEPFLDATAIAAVLGIPVKTVRQYAREGRLPCYHVGRCLRFRQSEVEQAVLDGRLAA